MEAPRNRQYKATKLWNEVVHSFRGGMPRGKHRRHMRTHDDCFGASEAASWLHRYLAGNQNFGPGVTRQQTLQLLQKFLESHIIEPVRSAKCRVIQDNKQLFRFVAHSPAKTPPSRTPPAGLARGRTPLSSRENGALEGLAPVPTPGRPRGFTLMASDDQEEPGEEMAGATLPRRNSAPQGALGRWEMHQLWASVTLARLRGFVGNVEDVLDGYRVSGEHIAHNMDRLSRNGVVILLDKTDDLPKWIINAMKCLIHWPRATGGGSCLPNYPGFEADVLKVISDFFCGLGTALLPPQLCRLFYFTFARLLDDVDDAERPPSPDDSIENLLHSMSILGNPSVEAPAQVKESVVRPLPLGRDLVYATAFEKAEPVTRVESRQSVDCELFLSTDTASTISTCSTARPASPSQNDSDGPSAQCGSQRSELQDCAGSVKVCRSEGPFSARLGSGFKRVANSSVPRSVDAHLGVDSASSTEIVGGFFAEDPKEFARAAATSCAPREAVVRSTASLDPHGGFLTLRQIKRDREQRREKCSGCSSATTSVRGEPGGYVNLGFGSAVNLDRCGVEEQPKPTSSPETLSRVCAAARPDSSSVVSSVPAGEGSVACLRYTRNQSSCESLPCSVGAVGRAAGTSYASVTSIGVRTAAFAVPEDSREVSRVVECLRVSSLLLPPRCRRYLHLLLRFVFKASKNDQLRLCPRRGNLEVLLDAFAGAFVSAADELAPESARELLRFMVRHCDRILAPPGELRREVEARQAILRRGTVRRSTHTHDTLLRCKSGGATQAGPAARLRQ